MLTALLLILNPSLSLFSQAFLNGDFEINTITECAYNNKNSEFNVAMNDCFASGQAGEIDIFTSNCDFGSPANGDWFIAIATWENKEDIVTLKLDDTLVEGSIYQIDYFQRSNATFSDLDSLIVGMSTDKRKFGEQIFISQPLVQSAWTAKSFTFKASANILHLAFSNQNKKSGWNFIDNIKLTFISSTGTEDTHLENNTTIYPNPSTGQTTITFPKEVSNIIIYSAFGQKKHDYFPRNGQTILNLDLSKQDKGIYFVVFEMEGKKVTKKLIVD